MTLDPKTDLHFTRTLPVPRALIWECWTTPAHLSQFFVPRPHRIAACDLDLRIGGRFNFTMEVEGNMIETRGVYLDLIPEEKLVFTDGYTEGWKPAPDPFMTAILLLADAPEGGTQYTAIARHRSSEDAKKHEEMGFYGGWGTVADQLVDYAQGLSQRRFR